MADSVLVAVVTGVVTAAGTLVGQFYLPRVWQRRGVNAGILTEMRRLSWVIKDHAAFWDSFKLPEAKAVRAKHPLIPFATPFFDALKEKIDLLYEDVAMQAAPYYGYIAFANAYQSQREKYVSQGLQEDFEVRYSKVLANLIKMAKGFDVLFARHKIAIVPDETTTESSVPIRSTESGKP